MTMEELFAVAVEKADEYVKASNDGDKSAKELSEMKKAANDALEAYNSEAANTAYTRWKDDDEHDPVRTALKVRFIPETKAISYSIDRDTGVMKKTVRDKSVKVDIHAMSMVIGNGFFADKSWFAMCQKLAYVIANALNDDLAADKNFSYAVDDAARDFNFGENVDPRSVKSVVKALQRVVDAIIYDKTTDAKGVEVNAIKMTSKHWRYVRECMTRQGKKPGEVAVCNTVKMAELVADAIHIVLSNGNVSLTTD